MKQQICTKCGYVGKAKRSIRGNALIEILLWLSFIILGIAYSIWRRIPMGDGSVCPKCGKNAMISIDSPVGEKLFKELNSRSNNLS